MSSQQNVTPIYVGNAALLPFYQNIFTAGFVPLLVIVLGIRSLICLLSILLNLALVWVTLCNRNLHGTCNWLIAMESLSLAFYMVGSIVIFGIVATGQNLIPLGTCFWLQCLPIFGRYFSMGMMGVIGVDRLKCVLLPRWSWEENSSKTAGYLLALCALCSFSPLWILYASLVVMLRQPNISVMCAPNEISQQEANGLATTVGMVLNLLSPSVYAILGLTLFIIKRTNIANTDTTKRIFKSLLMILLIQLLAWGTNSASLFFFSAFFSNSNLFLDDYQKWAVNAVFSYIQITATAANAPTLYVCSSEYRAAFRKQFGWFGAANDAGTASRQQADNQQLKKSWHLKNQRTGKQLSVVHPIPVN